jgi:hypothetical protein
MPSSSNKPLVFISYAHLGEPNPPEEPRWLSFIMEFLRPGVKGRKYEVWMNRLMPGGADWNPEIEAKIRACDIFVLLVSTRSTGSDDIVDNEIQIVRERQRGRGGQVGFGQRMADAPSGRQLSRGGTRARLVVLLPGFQRARPRPISFSTGRWPSSQ